MRLRTVSPYLMATGAAAWLTRAARAISSTEVFHGNGWRLSRFAWAVTLLNVTTTAPSASAFAGPSRAARELPRLPGRPHGAGNRRPPTFHQARGCPAAAGSTLPAETGYANMAIATRPHCRRPRHRTVFADLPAEVLAWLLAHGEVRAYAPDETIMVPGDAAERMLAVVAGGMQFYAVQVASASRYFASRPGR